MQVAVLAGGLGTRLRPITDRLPKCMTPVGDKPFLYYLLQLFKEKGTDEVILCTGYLGEQIEEYFGNGKNMGLRLLYSRENGCLLGTGGALKLAEPILHDSLLVVNGDTYLNIDYKTIYEDFNMSKAQALIVASQCPTDTCGDLAVDDNFNVTAYDKTNPVGKDYVNAGVMGLKRDILAEVNPAQVVSLEADIFPNLISRGDVRACITAKQFYDIGSFSGLGIFERTIKEICA
jgi:NDP-sugar pyrophosphorylase family protein